VTAQLASGGDSVAGGASTLGALGTSLFALLLVVGLILALAWLLRRLPGAALRGHGELRVVASLAVGMKERVLVIAAGEAQLVVGVTPERITLLHKLEKPLAEDAPARPDFRALLRGGLPKEPR